MFAAASFEYRRHRPELGALCQVVAETYRTLEDTSEQGFVAALPSFVKDELEAYLECDPREPRMRPLGSLCSGGLHC